MTREQNGTTAKSPVALLQNESKVVSMVFPIALMILARPKTVKVLL